MKQKILPFLTCMLMFSFLCKAQDIRLTFSSQFNNGWHALDSVIVTNFSQNHYSTTLYYPDTTLGLFTPVGISEFSPNENMDLQIYPNPFSNSTQIKFSLEQSGNTSLVLYDLSGKKIAQHNQYLEMGRHSFDLESCRNGFYLLQINTMQSSVSSKLLCYGNNSVSTATISYFDNQELKNEKKRKLDDPDFPFEAGDTLQIQTFISIADTFLIDNYTIVSEIENTDFVAEFSFTKISLTLLKEAICWQDLSTDTIYLFNSAEELNEQICNSEDIFTIDFTVYSLLLVHGKTTYGIDCLFENLKQISENEYELLVDIRLGMTAATDDWSVIMLVSKIPPEAIMIFNKSQDFSTEDNPLENTQWQAIAVFDSKTDTLIKELEPKYPEGSYTISFHSDNFLCGRGYANYLNGSYLVNSCFAIDIYLGSGTLAGSLYDEELYMDIMNRVDYYSIVGDTLKLYYDNRNYLLLERR